MNHIEALEVLHANARGTLTHTYAGSCPDGLEGPDVRDPDCPVCQALTILAQDTTPELDRDDVHAATTPGVRAVLAHTAALALVSAATNPHLRTVGHGGISVRGLREYAQTCSHINPLGLVPRCAECDAPVDARGWCVDAAVLHISGHSEVRR